MIELLPKRWQRKIQYAFNFQAPDLGACWELTSRWRSGNGYSKLRRHGKAMMAHRAIYEHVHDAPIDAGLVLDHLCRNRGCVNPNHVEPVSAKVNTERGLGVLHQFKKAA